MCGYLDKTEYGNFLILPCSFKQCIFYVHSVCDRRKIWNNHIIMPSPSSFIVDGNLMAKRTAQHIYC